MTDMSTNNPFLQLVNSNGGGGSGGGATPTPTSMNTDNPFLSLASPQSQNSVKPQGTFWDTLDVINKNFANIANGDLQVLAKGISFFGVDTSNFQKQLADQQTMHQRDYQAAMKSSPVAGTIADVGSSIGAALSTPGAQPLAAESLGANFAGRIAGSSGASAIASGSQYIDPNSNETHIDNAVQGGILGGALQGGGEYAISKAGSAIKSGAESLFTTPVQEAADSFDKGLLTTAGGATGNTAIQSAESVLGSVPVLGTREAIKSGTQALRQEAGNTLEDLGVGLNSKSALGSELDSHIQSSYQAAKEATNNAYDKALNIAKSSGLDVPLTQTQSVASKAINELQSLSESGISTNISSKPGQMLSDLANLPDGKIPAKNFDILRRKLNSSIDALSKGGDEEGLLPAFKQIRSSMDLDLDSLGSKNSEFGNALKEARNIYIDRKKPFQDISILKNATQGKLDVDELINGIVKNDRPALTSNILRQLSPQGQTSLSTAVIQKVFSNSLGKKGTGINRLDLDKFTTGINNLGETLNVLPSAEQSKIKGLQRLLTRGDSLIKADKAGNSKLIQGISGGALAVTGHLAGLSNLLVSAGGVKAISKLLTSPSITRKLIKLGGGKLTTTTEDGIIKNTLRRLVSSTGLEGLSQFKEPVKSGLIPAAVLNVENNND